MMTPRRFPSWFGDRKPSLQEVVGDVVSGIAALAIREHRLQLVDHSVSFDEPGDVGAQGLGIVGAIERANEFRVVAAGVVS